MIITIMWKPQKCKYGQGF